MGIEVVTRAGIDYDAESLKSLLNFGMAELGLNPECALDVLLVDEDEMTQLHIKWMDEPGPTDVLTFPMDELVPFSAQAGILGDIVLCPAVALKQADEAGHSFESEMSVLAIHGLLHLVGYDHATPKEEIEMFDLQDGIVARWSA